MSGAIPFELLEPREGPPLTTDEVLDLLADSGRAAARRSRPRERLHAPSGGGTTEDLAAWLACCLGRGEYAPFEREDALELASLLRERRMAAGATILRQSEEPGSVVIVREGQVALVRRARGRNLLLNVLGPGDVLADIPLIAHTPMLYTARMITPGGVLHLVRDDFVRLVRTHPQIALRWLLSAAERMERTQRRLVEVLEPGLEVQLSLLLMDQAAGGTVRLTQQTLAELVGAQRTSVNRVLKALEREGLISVAYREVKVLDPEGLRARTGAERAPSA